MRQHRTGKPGGLHGVFMESQRIKYDLATKQQHTHVLTLYIYLLVYVFIYLCEYIRIYIYISTALIFSLKELGTNLWNIGISDIQANIKIYVSNNVN